MTETKQAEIPICIECEHIRWTGSEHHCVRLATGSPDPVDGRIKIVGSFLCGIERGENFGNGRRERCGPEGRFFKRDSKPKPKPPELIATFGTESVRIDMLGDFDKVFIRAWDRFVDWVDGWRKS